MATATELGNAVLEKRRLKAEQHTRMVELCSSLIPLIQADLNQGTTVREYLAHNKDGGITALAMEKRQDWYAIIKDSKCDYFRITLSRQISYGCYEYQLWTSTSTAENKAMNEALKANPIIPPDDTCVKFSYMDCRGCNGPTYKSDGYREKAKAIAANPKPAPRLLELLYELLGRKLPFKAVHTSVHFGGEPDSYEGGLYSASLTPDGHLLIRGNHSGVFSTYDRIFTREEWLEHGKAHLGVIAAKARKGLEFKLASLKRELAAIKKAEKLAGSVKPTS